MLLELRGLSISLDQAGVIAGRLDDHLRPYPRLTAFQIEIDPNGNVISIGHLDTERVACLRKYECSTGGLRESTPGFKIKSLFRIKPDADKKAYQKEFAKFRKALEKGALPSAEQRQTCLDGLLRQSEPNWEEPAEAVEVCLRVAAQTLLDRLATAAEPEATLLAPMRELLRRSRLLHASELYKQLQATTQRQIVTAAPGSHSELLVELLFAKASVVVLELAEAGTQGPANSDAIWDAINRHLCAAATATLAVGTGGGALPVGIFGEPADSDDAKMPERRVPRLGNVKLRSLTEGAPCQRRYGLIESGSCPVGQSVRDELAAALDWVVRPEREYITWADVSDSCGFDKDAILLAYPEKLPALTERLSAFLSQPRRDAVLAEKRFEEFAKTVTVRLRGLVQADPRTLIHVFVLVKADRARTKLLYSRQFAAGRLIAAAAEWQEAAHALPPVFIRQFTTNRGEICWTRPLVPFPAEVVWCLNTAWQRAGTHAERVSGIDVADGLTLLLDTGSTLQVVAGRALHQALVNSTPLLLAVAQAQQQNLVHRMATNYGKQPLLLPSILGLLLAKTGANREEYMSNNPYLIGRLLSLADQLHRNYCKHERKGQQPPQLLGNALMPTALDNPAAGLARLSERLPLYYRVADTSLRSELAQIENLIDKDNLRDCCNDAERAQMLLGYLARPDLLASQDPVSTPQPGEQQ